MELKQLRAEPNLEVFLSTVAFRFADLYISHCGLWIVAELIQFPA